MFINASKFNDNNTLFLKYSTKFHVKVYWNFIPKNDKRRLSRKRAIFLRLLFDNVCNVHLRQGFHGTLIAAVLIFSWFMHFDSTFIIFVGFSPDITFCNQCRLSWSSKKFAIYCPQRVLNYSLDSILRYTEKPYYRIILTFY